jgi:hypothetical protein
VLASYYPRTSRDWEVIWGICGWKSGMQEKKPAASSLAVDGFVVFGLVRQLPTTDKDYHCTRICTFTSSPGGLVDSTPACTSSYTISFNLFAGPAVADRLAPSGQVCKCDCRKMSISPGRLCRPEGSGHMNTTHRSSLGLNR